MDVLIFDCPIKYLILCVNVDVRVFMWVFCICFYLDEITEQSSFVFNSDDADKL